jgi:hypothetical protein
MRRFRTFGDKPEICQVRTPKLSFKLSRAMLINPFRTLMRYAALTGRVAPDCGRSDHRLK